MVPVAPQHRHLLLFNLEMKIFQFKCLPRVFTKILKPAIERLISLGIHLAVYVHGRHTHHSNCCRDVQRVYPHDAVPPRELRIHNQQQEITSHSDPRDRAPCDGSEFPDNGLKAPRGKIKKIRLEAQHMLDHPTTRSLSQLLGKLNATNPALQMAPLFCHSLQSCLKQALETNSQDYNSIVQLSLQALEDLQWWEVHLSKWNGRSLIIQQSSMTIMSLYKGGGFYAMRHRPEVLGPLMSRLSTSIAWRSWQRH